RHHGLRPQVTGGGRPRSTEIPAVSDPGAARGTGSTARELVRRPELLESLTLVARLRAGAGAQLGLGEQPPRGVHVPRPLRQRLVIPFAARPLRSEEVAAVDVDRARTLPDRVHDRVDGLRAEHRGLARTERARAVRLDAVPRAPPEHVVLA